MNRSKPETKSITIIDNDIEKLQIEVFFHSVDAASFLNFFVVTLLAFLHHSPFIKLFLFRVILSSMGTGKKVRVMHFLFLFLLRFLLNLCPT